MSKSEIAPKLRPVWQPSSLSTFEKMSAALENVEKSVVVVGFNACTRCLPELACAVVFCDAGALVASLPVAAHLQGVPWAALPSPPPRLLENLKIRKLACIGLKREALADEALAAAVLSARTENQLTVPFGDFAVSLESLKPQQKIEKTKVVKKIEKPATVKNSPAVPAKRFFSSLDSPFFVFLDFQWQKNHEKF